MDSKTGKNLPKKSVDNLSTGRTRQDTAIWVEGKIVSTDPASPICSGLERDKDTPDGTTTLPSRLDAFPPI
jgi:hypothetical protein